MLLFAVFVAELLALSFLSRALVNQIYATVLLPTRSRSIGITVIVLILFPGTVIHELSHLFTAEILGVRTGKLELAPHLSAQAGSIKHEEVHAGTVAIAQTDPIRRSLIGLAPLTTGITILTALSYFLPDWISHAAQQIQNGQFVALPVLESILGIYLVFAISNSMFSSKEDLKGVPAVVLTLLLFIGAFYLVGLRITLSGTLLTTMTAVGQTLVTSLGLVLAVNGILLLITSILVAITSRLTRRIISF